MLEQLQNEITINFISSKLMLKSTLRVFSLFAKQTNFTFKQTPLTSLTQQLSFAFCKHDKHTQKKQEEEKVHKHQEKEKEPTKKNEKTAEEQVKSGQEQHVHGPGCKHDHGHHHESHHEPHSQHTHNAAHPNVKLSKLTFEQLIELKTDESLKYAHMIYEQEEKKLKAGVEEKEHLLKNLEFYKKVDEEIIQKQRKLEENIKLYEEEAALSKHRAQKEIEESKNFAVTKIAKELLEVADCVASCRKYAEANEKKDKYIEMIVESHQVIKDILKKFEIEEFDPTGTEYNPNLQESLLQIPTPPGCKHNEVAMVMRTGYTIKGRLLRSARVGVFN